MRQREFCEHELLKHRDLDMVELADKIAIVTGAGRGVGQATALRLARAGARVVVNDLDAREAEECVREIQTLGGRALACPGDVTAAEFPEQLRAVSYTHLTLPTKRIV